MSPCKSSWLSNIDAIRASRVVLNVSEGCINSSGKSGRDSMGPIHGERSIGLRAGETPGGGGGGDGDTTDLVMPGPGATCAALLEVLSECQGGGGGICFMIGAPDAVVKKGGAAAGAPNAAGALTEIGFSQLADGALMSATWGMAPDFPRVASPGSGTRVAEYWPLVPSSVAEVWSHTFQWPAVRHMGPTGTGALSAVQYDSI